MSEKKNALPGEPYVKSSIIASFLGISRETVKRKADAGVLPCVKLPDGAYLFRISEIASVLEQAKNASGFRNKMPQDR